MEPVTTGRKPGGIYGFTLMELLTVLAIIAVVSAITITGFSNITGATALTSTGNQIVAQMTQAQQRALADNSHVEVRLYQPTSDAIDSHWSLVLVRKMPDAEYQAVVRPFHFPTDVAISSSPTLSTLVSELPEQTDEGTVIRSGSKDSSFTYTSFKFGPDGSTDLPVNAGGDTWHLTLVKAGGTEADSDGPPKNFYTIRIDPFTGAVRTYRP